jgi:hypothetical protein
MKDSKFKRRDFEATLAAKALRDPEFRRRLVANPTETYAAELNHKIPDGVRVKIVEDSENTFYVTIPFLPADLKVTEEQLEAVARRELTHRNPCWGVGDGLE